MKNLYEILGVTNLVKKEQIKKAYREKSAKCHPDVGGDAEEFIQINKAYQILMDDEKRARYDKGETIDNILNPKNNRSFEIIAHIFCITLDNFDAEDKNIIKIVKQDIKMNINKIEEEIEKRNALKINYEKALKKIKHKDSNNILVQITNSRIQIKIDEIAKLQSEKHHFDEALKIIKDFNYDIEEIMMIRGFGVMGNWGSSTTTV